MSFLIIIVAFVLAVLAFVVVNGVSKQKQKNAVLQMFQIRSLYKLILTIVVVAVIAMLIHFNLVG